MQKGVAYSTVAIVALLGILLLAFWSINQLSTTQIGTTYTERTKNDMAIARLEMAKRYLTQDLSHSSYEASLDLGANGGTILPKTYWYCNNKPTPPTLKEFKYAMGTYINDYINSYIGSIEDSEISQMGIKVSEYGCCGVDDPGESNCLQADSSKCEYFTSNALQGGLIEVTDPAYASYSGALSSDITSDRIFWIYYQLKQYMEDNLLVRTIVSSYQEDCPGPVTTEAKLDAAYKEACKSMEFDEYIECTYEVLCQDIENPVACLNIPCEREELTEDLCYGYSAQSTSAENDANMVGKSVSAQAGGLAGVQIKFTLTDTKYNIPSYKGLNPLEFNVWTVIFLAEPECTPIN